MNLHRAIGADWEKIEPEQRNRFQKIAAKTRGIVAPANGVSVVGIALTLDGVRDMTNGHYVRGSAKIIGGRVCDLVDGIVADKTGTKSPTGEAVDAGLDKVAAAGAIVGLAQTDIVPVPALGIIGLQNAANVAFTAIAKVRGVEIHPTANGKHSGFAQWVALGSYGLSAATEQSPALSKSLEVVGHAATAVTAVLGARATYEYYQAATAPIPTETPHLTHVLEADHNPSAVPMSPIPPRKSS